MVLRKLESINFFFKYKTEKNRLCIRCLRINHVTLNCNVNYIKYNMSHNTGECPHFIRPGHLVLFGNKR